MCDHGRDESFGKDSKKDTIVIGKFDWSAKLAVLNKTRIEHRENAKLAPFQRFQSCM